MPRMEKLKKLKDHGYEIYHSLSKSYLRIDVIMFIYRNPNRNTLAEIAEGLGVSQHNIKGAIIGHYNGYLKNRSLLDLELLSCERASEGITHFILTNKGQEIAKMLVVKV
jgi:predicted transcriptional regulator with HTH domain